MNSALPIQIPTLETSNYVSLSHVYQPIVSLPNDKVCGFESLLRSQQLHSPESLFAHAIARNQLFDLDIYSIMQSITTFCKVPAIASNKYLSINVFPSTIKHPSFLWTLEELLEKVSLEPTKIIFELNEAETIEEMNDFPMVLKDLKSLGYRIALDDLGKGQSSLRSMIELEPDGVKLDRFFSADLEFSIKKQRFLDWITSYLKAEGIIVTLEGIETEAQLIIAKQMGVHFGQGYYLGRPEPIMGQALRWK